MFDQASSNLGYLGFVNVVFEKPNMIHTNVFLELTIL